MSNLKNFLKINIKKYLLGSYENLLFNRQYILNSYLQKPRAKDVIVSLTTYSPRLEIFEYAVLSILAGTILPEKIYIYVPKGFVDLVNNNPNSFVRNHNNMGIIELVTMEEDLGCHSKYFYSFQRFGQSKDIIICDDDVVYYPNWIKDLLKKRDKNINCDVFAFKVVEVTKVNNKIAPYDDWIHFSKEYHPNGRLLYAEGVGGILFKKGRMNKEVLNKDAFLKITPKADDVWLWFCIYLNGLNIKYVVVPKYKKLLYVIPDSQRINLWMENTINKRNDTYVANCSEYFLNKYNFDFCNFKQI